MYKKIARSAGFMLLNGTLAASSAFFVGWALEEVLGVKTTV